MQPVIDFLENILQNVYFKFLMALVVTLVLAFLAKLIMKKVLKPLAKKTKTVVDDLIVKSISSLVFYIILLVGLKIGLGYFQFQAEYHKTIINTFMILIIAVMIIRIIDNFSKQWTKDWKHKTKTTADDRLIPIFEKILKAFVVILAVFFIFDAWKINLSPLLMTAGITGIAIGMAVKEPLTNILGGLQLVLDQAFKVGDKVRIESGELGVIMDIGLRSTKLKTYDNEVIFIPNGYLANAKIKNYTQPDFSIRVNVGFGVEYGSDPAKVRQVVIEAVKKIEKVLDFPEPVVEFLEMSDSSINFTVRVWVEDYSYAYGMELEMREVVYRGLNSAGIGIPFPTRTVYTKSLD